MVSNAWSSVVGFLFWIIVARFYAPGEIGLSNAIISIMLWIGRASTFGFDLGLIRYLPMREKKQEIINTCSTASGLLSLIIAIIYILGLSYWSPKLLFIRDNWVFTSAFIVFTVGAALGQIQMSIFIGFRSVHFILIQSVIGVLKLLPAVLLITYGTFGIFFSSNIVALILTAVGLVFILKILPGYRPALTIRREIFKDMTRFSLGNYLASIINMTPQYVMPLIIIAVLGEEANAYIFIPFSIAGVLSMVIGSVSQSLLAESSHDRAALRSQIIKAAKLILVFLVPGITLILVLARPLLSLFGAEYAQNSVLPLYFFALMSIPHTIAMIYVNTMWAQMKVRPVIYLSIFNALFIIGMSYWLMNRVGLIGVGIAWLSDYAIVAIVLMPKLLKLAGIPLRNLLGLKGKIRA